MKNNRLIFYRNSNNIVVKALIAFLVLLLISLYQYKYNFIAYVHEGLYGVGEGIRNTAYKPISLYASGKEYALDKNKLIETNKSLKLENMKLRERLTKYTNILKEKDTLQALNNKMIDANEDYVLAKVVSFNVNIHQHEISLNVGSKKNVMIGDVVFDGKSVVGQVIGVDKAHARVMLLTDSRSAIPALINKRAYHAILLGLGNKELELIDVADTIDVKLGDEIVSSGLGGRFAHGLAIGKVSFVNKIPGEHFMKIYVQPYVNIKQTTDYIIIHKHKLIGKEGKG